MIATAGALLLALAGISGGDDTPMQCDAGPVARELGGSDWMVLSCSDGRSMVVVSAQGNPAGPFVFFLKPLPDGAYAISGEGNGDKAASDAALEALTRYTTADLAALLAATKAAH